MGELVSTYFEHDVVDHRCIRCGAAVEGQGTVLFLRVDERGGVYEEIGRWISWPCRLELSEEEEMDLNDAQ